MGSERAIKRWCYDGTRFGERDSLQASCCRLNHFVKAESAMRFKYGVLSGMCFCLWSCQYICVIPHLCLSFLVWCVISDGSKISHWVLEGDCGGSPHEAGLPLDHCIIVFAISTIWPWSVSLVISRCVGASRWRSSRARMGIITLCTHLLLWKRN